jgi:DNA mismatch repair protein MutL
MEDIVKLLPDIIANQIAAGEVVQRPSSVVKELMENAVDAGANRVQLIVKDAGKTWIQVIDNGCGMTDTDARMSFERHATSKIRKPEDLYHIRTMGFRGEALASIAAVSQVEMRTRMEQNKVGTQLIIEAGVFISQEATAANPGTSITVKNLFYNVPARRNFLKSNAAETRHIIDEFQRVALAHPNISFTFHHNGAELFHLKEGNLRQRVVAMFGHPYNERLVPIEEKTTVLTIYGFIGKPETAKKMRGEQFLFVNNRFIKSHYLHHAIVTAYDEMISSDAHPLYTIFLDIDPARIDVNVHPTKQEIKFDDEKIILQ